MRLIFIFSLVFFAIGAKSQIVDVPNANFKNKLLAANSSNTIARNLGNAYFKIDANSDGQIQVSEAEQVSYLDVSDANIISLVGVEAFVNLKYLDCSSNFISVLNIPNLTLLQELRCNNNELDALDVNMLTNLKMLVAYSNDLITFDVSALNNLENLDCYNNNLTSLDLGAKPNLTHFACQKNNLTTINVSNFSSLQYFYCYENQLESINVQGTTAMLDFRPYDNLLTSLDVTSAINLQLLDCSENQLTSIDLTNQTFLESLYVDFNSLTTINVTNCLFIDKISCHNNSPLASIFMKNGSEEETLTIYSCPNLSFICCDPEDLTYVQNQVNSAVPSCTVSTDCALGVNQNTFANTSFYPNPVKGSLYFASELEVRKIQVYDLSGRLLMSKPAVENNVDLSDLSTGTYILKMHTPNSILSEKIVVRN